MRLFDEKVRDQLAKYIIQCLIATATLAVVLFYMDLFTDTTVVASIGASAFIVFTMPHKNVSKEKYILGGYAVGTIVGILFHMLLISVPSIPAGVLGALAVGVAMFLMVVLDLEHPPAAAHALGVTVGGFSMDMIIFLAVVCICILLIRRLLGRWLIDLI